MGRFSAQDNVKNGYLEDTPDTGKTTARVSDSTTHDKLDTVIANLGGSVDTTPDIQNISVPNKDTEQNYTLPTNTKGFILRSRSKATLRLAYGALETNTKYLTIPAGNSFTDSNFYTSQTIYFQSSKDGDVVELVVYT